MSLVEKKMEVIKSTRDFPRRVSIDLTYDFSVSFPGA